jgi:CBS domain-containing protein
MDKQNSAPINLNSELSRNFIFLSEIIGISVYDSNNKFIGKISDLVATPREIYPKITAVVIGKKLYPWLKVKTILKNKMLVIDTDLSESSITIQETDFLIKDIFWDKQIVDISGSKVVRVNDLHLLKENSNLWLAHVDIGFKGLLRRLGWLKPFEFVSLWLFSYEIKDRFISWKYVQPISEQNIVKTPLQLKIPHARLNEIHPADLAEILVDLGSEERIIILESLDTKTAAKTLQELPKNIRIIVAESLNKQTFAAILDEMAVDESVDLLYELPAKLINQLFHVMTDKDKIIQIKDLLVHPERIAGSIMNTEYNSVPNTFTVEQTLIRLKEKLPEIESIYYTYVTDEKETLVGVITIRKLLINDPAKPITEIMRKRVVKVRVETDKRDVAQLFLKYNFDVIPVVDKQNKIKGIITLKDSLESAYPQIKEQTK